MSGPVAIPSRTYPGKLQAARVTDYHRLTQVVLTDELSRTLFAEYAAHKASDRGEEEIGWVLLGLREQTKATILASLPAGAERDAGETHVRFNSDAQAVAGRMLSRRYRIRPLGVVHTQPGRLRHPSHADYDGDRIWVNQLPGAEGVFAIGTCEVRGTETAASVGEHPLPHVQQYGAFRFDWYTLASGDRRYQTIPVELTIGPDFALPLRPVWPTLELYAERLERLTRQINGVHLDVAIEDSQPVVVMTIPLTEPDEMIRVVLNGKQVHYYYHAGPEVFQPDLPSSVTPDQAVYLLLAELAARG